MHSNRNPWYSKFHLQYSTDFGSQPHTQLNFTLVTHQSSSGGTDVSGGLRQSRWYALSHSSHMSCFSGSFFPPQTQHAQCLHLRRGLSLQKSHSGLFWPAKQLTCKTVNNLQRCTQLMLSSIVTSKLIAVIHSICMHTGLLSTHVRLMCYSPKWHTIITVNAYQRCATIKMYMCQWCIICSVKVYNCSLFFFLLLTERAKQTWESERADSERNREGVKAAEV